MENVEPLSEQELDELDAFLLSDAVPEHCMDLSMLDGFVTALAAGPATPAPERWLPEIWGGEMRWSGRAQEERITTLILRHAAAVYWYLRDEPEFFDPLLFESDDAGAVSGEGDGEGAGVPLLDDWCAGFVEGIVLDEAAWQPLMDHAEDRALLQPILRYGSEDGVAALEAEPPSAERRIADAAALGEAVLAINAYWSPQRKAASTLRRDGAKTGRNDPCPCGSGRKYKKCCGAGAA